MAPQPDWNSATIDWDSGDGWTLTIPVAMTERVAMAVGEVVDEALQGDGISVAMEISWGEDGAIRLSDHDLLNLDGRRVRRVLGDAIASGIEQGERREAADKQRASNFITAVGHN